MAFISCDFKSDVLGMGMNLKVILPNENTSVPMCDKKVLLLLHGLSDDNSAWSRYSSIERYAIDADMAVIMPAAHRSFYTNMTAAGRFFDYIGTEVPAMARKLFGLSREPGKNFIAGLSMGGYGAYKIALSFPESYRAAASLSGVLDITHVLCNQTNPLMEDAEVDNIFPTRTPDTSNCVMKLLGMQASAGKKLPALLQCCGTEDFLYQANQHFKDFAGRLNVCHTYWESPGSHSWEYWDANIEKIITLFRQMD